MGKASIDELEEQDPMEQLRNFVVEAKVEAFLDRYIPCDESKGDLADEVFDDIRLRRFFNAYPRPCGDPLVIYVDEHLKKWGFRFTVSEMSGDAPVICVKVRR